MLFQGVGWRFELAKLLLSPLRVILTSKNRIKQTPVPVALHILAFQSASVELILLFVMRVQRALVELTVNGRWHFHQILHEGVVWEQELALVSQLVVRNELERLKVNSQIFQRWSFRVDDVRVQVLQQQQLPCLRYTRTVKE